MKQAQYNTRPSSKKRSLQKGISKETHSSNREFFQFNLF
ncbi:hypothetical protein LEP1GSC151_0280 [Leptospira interrogans serovar Grippotyphosa str. LT2186]|uniref:Uncharacterized protein n=1 Tax=Leptospira interrogans serovar Grippotyphosa str. LT2186 TaxID=1001599 RepID=M3I7P1_LEPIR|nr:hypothetical protein LEP1GSC151_0280 [Leptospira interrogans serovar Grippotyphosa str. LT2186]